jgi:hypothetical protein
VTALGAIACKQSRNGCQQLLQAAQHIKKGHVVLVKCYVNTEHFEQELTLRDLPEVRRRLAQAVAVFSKNDSEAVSACDTGLSPFIIFSASMVCFPVSFEDCPAGACGCREARCRRLLELAGLCHTNCFSC